jgi:hypothetical protein
MGAPLFALFAKGGHDAAALLILIVLKSHSASSIQLSHSE